MIMLDFIYNGSADLFGTGRERKIQTETFPVGFETTPLQSTTGKSDRSATVVTCIYQVEHL